MEVIEQARYARKDEARVFFAIWPGGATREQLLEVASGLPRDFGCTGRRIRAENIHLTLVFVGNVDNRALQALCGAAEGIAKKSTAPFELVIQKIGYWKHNCVAYAAPLGIPPGLEELVCLLRKATESVGFSPEERAYKPHVTLMRDATCPMLSQNIEPLVWEVREWLLVKSEQTREGVVYSPVARWMLGTSG